MTSGDDRNEDESIARLLQVAGERERPDAAMQADVRAAVEAEWREVVAARRGRRRVTAWAMAAGVGLAALGVWLVVPLLDRAPQTVASLALASGPVEQRTDGSSTWTPLAPGSPIMQGTEIRTTGDSRAALSLKSGIGVRLDRGSQLAFAGGEEASLLGGAAYVDSGATASPGAAAFALHTAAGTIRHLGTQYEARIDGARVKVAIREGKVLIDSPGGSVSGVAGEQILFEEGRISRSDLPAHDVSWNWLGVVTPAYSIEGRSLADFLHWAARETGRELVFADAGTEEAASRIILRGSVQGLSPDQSIAAVGATTGLAIEVAGERIEVRPATR